MEKFQCKYCKSDKYLWLLNPVRVEIPGNYITSTFHVKELCGQCHRFQKFVKQTDEVLQKLKNAVILDGIDIVQEIPFE